MGLARSTFYDPTPVPVTHSEILTRIGAICDDFECYGYRRVGAALRHQGVVVNSKKLRRLMRDHGLQPKQRRRYVVTTDSDHAGPIFPDLAKDIVPDRPNQLWVADLTYVCDSWRLRLPGCHPGCLVAQGRRLCDQPVDGCPDRRGRVEGCHSRPSPRRRLHPPRGQRVAICFGDLPRAAGISWIGRFDEPSG